MECGGAVVVWLETRGVIHTVELPRRRCCWGAEKTARWGGVGGCSADWRHQQDVHALRASTMDM